MMNTVNLISSADTTPLPTVLVQALESSIASAESITVRAMTSAHEDHLAVHLHGRAVDIRAIDEIARDLAMSVELDTEIQPGAGMLVLVGRSVATDLHGTPAAGSGSTTASPPETVRQSWHPRSRAFQRRTDAGARRPGEPDADAGPAAFL